MNRVALIMRSKNEMPYLPDALQSLHDQMGPAVDLWAVDSGSTDGSLEQLRRAVSPEQLVEIRPEEYIPGKVLNDMIARTSAEIIVFQNADAIFQSTDALAQLLQPIFDGTADATMCAQVTRANAKWIVSYDYQRAYDPRNIKGSNADFFSAVTCAFRRELWEQVAFPETGYAEDVAWAKACRARGARFKLVCQSVVEHSHNYTFEQLFRKKFRHGVTFAREYGRRPRLGVQALKLCKEWARDFFRALRTGHIATIPYNVAYRAVIHSGLYRGLKEGSNG